MLDNTDTSNLKLTRHNEKMYGHIITLKFQQVYDLEIYQIIHM